MTYGVWAEILISIVTNFYFLFSFSFVSFLEADVEKTRKLKNAKSLWIVRHIEQSVRENLAYEAIGYKKYDAWSNRLKKN